MSLCVQCRASFDITDEDLGVYDKVSPVIAGKKYSIPAPSICPDCRLQTRMAFRNERKFYRRQCDFTHENITQELLACEDCKKNYRVIEQELQFYKEMSLPIPLKCLECRYQELISQRNPRRIWERTCDKCNKTIHSTYTTERPEEVYCDECYLKNVY